MCLAPPFIYCIIALQKRAPKSGTLSIISRLLTQCKCSCVTHSENKLLGGIGHQKSLKVPGEGSCRGKAAAVTQTGLFWFVAELVSNEPLWSCRSLNKCMSKIGKWEWGRKWRKVGWRDGACSDCESGWTRRKTDWGRWRREAGLLRVTVTSFLGKTRWCHRHFNTGQSDFLKTEFIFQKLRFKWFHLTSVVHFILLISFHSSSSSHHSSLSPFISFSSTLHVFSPYVSLQAVSLCYSCFVISMFSVINVSSFKILSQLWGVTVVGGDGSEGQKMVLVTHLDLVVLHLVTLQCVTNPLATASSG